MPIILVLAIVLLVPNLAHAAAETICSNAAVLYCDNFEDRPLGNQGSNTWQPVGGKTGGWALDQAGTNTVANDQFFNDGAGGTHSLKLHHPACTWTSDQANCGAGQQETFPAFNVTDLYVRHYVKWSANFSWPHIGLKHFHHECNNAPISTRCPWWNIHGAIASPAIQMYFENEGFSSAFLDQNQGSNLAFAKDQWYCLETHTMRSGSTGTYEMWIDSTLRLRYTNVALNSTVTWFGISPTGFWNTYNGSNPITQSECLSTGQPGITWTGSACQVAAQDKWMDNVVLSTARIGCLGGGGGPTPPVPPTNLHFVSLLIGAVALGATKVWLRV